MGIDVAADAECSPNPTSALVRPTEIKAWAWSSASMRSNTFFRASFFLLGRIARGRPRPPDACTDEDDEKDEDDGARGVDPTSEDADVADAMALAAAAAIAMDAADRAEDEAAAEGSAGTGSASRRHSSGRPDGQLSCEKETKINKKKIQETFRLFGRPCELICTNRYMILFLDTFSITPIPSSTFVMS